ncbi:MAG: M48 family peptidase [Acidobacteria bacterium]|nr:MAG: M48 family peptidase [Acidobacteriota bacterium]
MEWNVYAAVVLAALVGEYLLRSLGRWLNLKALRREPPAELADVYDPEAYRRSQDYTRDAIRFGLVNATVNLLALLAFWFAGGFAWLDARVRALELPMPWDGVIFIGALALAQAVLLGLPASVYETFVLEQRYGFNRTTPRTFVLDWLKGLLLGLVIGGPLVALILVFFARFGDDAWWISWLVVSVLIVLLQLIFPIWILPLFNRFQPLEDGELRRALEAYARRVGFRLDGIFVMDGSRRSSRGNAFFTGFGRSKRIALFDTLIAEHSVPELVAILAHEVGHYKRRHLLKGMALSIAHLGLLFYLLSLVLGERGLYQAFGIAEPSIAAGLVFFGLLYAPVELLLSLGMNALLRRHEYEADRFASETAGPAALTSALKKLARSHLTNLTPHPLYVALNDSHPPLVERLAAIARCSASSTS